MKLSNLAIALTVISLPAVTLAQSSVELYGSVDAGLAYTNTGGTNPTTGQKAANKAELIQGGLSSNIWGVKGTEDLGGGLKALFVLETQFALDTGEAIGGGFTRRSIVGLSGPWGEVTMGRDWTPSFWIGALQDINGYTLLGNTLPFWSGNGGRSNRAILYNTPKWNGLMARTMVSLGDWTPGRPRNEGKMLSIGVQYVQPTCGLTATAYYTHRTGGPQAASGSVVLFNNQVKTSDDYGVGLGYCWEKARVVGAYNEINPEAGVTGQKMWVLGFGVSPFPVGEFTFQAVHLQKTSAPGPTGRAMLYSASYVYPLSKRTRLYVSVGSTQNNDAGTFGLTSAGSSWSPVSPGGNPRAAMIGMSHRF